MSGNKDAQRKVAGASPSMRGLKVPGVILKVAGEVPGWPSASMWGPRVAGLDEWGCQDSTEDS